MMGFVCTAGHFIGMNLALTWDENYRTVCHCDRATFLLLHYEGVTEDARRQFEKWRAKPRIGSSPMSGA